MKTNWNFEYEVVVFGSVAEELNSSIFKYWAFNGEEFTYPIKELMALNDFMPDFLENICKYSYAKLIFDNCKLCSGTVFINVYNRREFTNILRDSHHTCNICKEYSPNYNSNIDKVKPIGVMIRELSRTELKILNGIVALKTKKLIYRHIFNNDVNDEKIWKIVNSLQRKGLIWMDRDESWKIKSFKFSKELSNYL